MKLDVFSLSFGLYAWHIVSSVDISADTAHGGLKAWMRSNLTTRARPNKKTSIFKMSPLRPYSSIFTAYFCLHQLSVSTGLNSTTLRTMEIQARLTRVTFVWGHGWCLGSFHDGWRTSVNCAADGDLCQATSADIILSARTLLSIKFCECFHRD